MISPRFWLLAVGFLSAAFPVVAEQEGDFSYTIKNGTVSISGYTGKDRAVIIPSAIKGMPVREIGRSAFYNLTDLTSVAIPEGVLSIEILAFSGCTALTKMTIPASVSKISSFVFSDCPNLPEFIVDPANPHYNSIDGVLFNETGTDLISFPGGKKGSYIIPDGVTTLYGGAFKGCAGLTGLKFSKNLADIGGKGFEGCTSLPAITVDETNPNFSSIDGVVFNKKGTEIMVFPGGKAGSSYAIPNGVTSIGGFAFIGCTRLTSVTVPEGVRKLGYGAFMGCTGLTSISLPASLTSIENARTAFGGCTSLTAINVNGVKSGYSSVDGVLLHKYNFHGDKNNPVFELTVFPKGKAVSSYTIPDGITSIGDNAFWGLKTLNHVIFPKGVKVIRPFAFADCTDLSQVTLSDGVATIYGSAFKGCMGLTDINLPDSVNELADDVFANCTALKSITFEGNAPAILGTHDLLQGITLRYYKGASGFTDPRWSKLKLLEIDPATEFFDWISNDGKTIKANFVKLEGEAVVVRMEDGKEHKIPFARLSPASVAQAGMLGGLGR